MLKARQWRQQKLQLAENNLQATLSNLPRNRVSSTGALAQYIEALTPRLQDYMDHFGSMQHRRLAKKVRFLTPGLVLCAGKLAC